MKNIIDSPVGDHILAIVKMTMAIPAMEKKGALGALAALSQETRLDVFRLLVTEGPAGLPAGVIAERLNVLPASLTFHLQQLVHAGLLTQRRLGRQQIYAAEYTTMNELLTYLTENCCGQGAPAAPVCDPAVGCCSTTSTDSSAA